MDSGCSPARSPPSSCASPVAGVGCWAYYWATNPGWNAMRVTWYLVGSIISGIVIAGVVVWYLSRALAATGALERFESGRSKARV